MRFAANTSAFGTYVTLHSAARSLKGFFRGRCGKHPGMDPAAGLLTEGHPDDARKAFG